MKKIINIISVAILITFSSCVNQDPSNWYPEAAEYTGQFVIALYEGETMSDQTLVNWLDPHKPIYLYNTAANNTEEIWFSDEEQLFQPEGIRVKFKITGPASDFSSAEKTFSAAYFNVLADWDINEDSSISPPTGLGETHTIQLPHIKAYLDAGKIIKDGATTPGGNIADSIYVKINTLGANLQFTSYYVEEDDRTDPSIHYAWEFTQATPETSLDHTYILSGFRWTGYDEDMDIYE